jgi:hypothetical protein
VENKQDFVRKRGKNTPEQHRQRKVGKEQGHSLLDKSEHLSRGRRVVGRFQKLVERRLEIQQ